MKYIICFSYINSILPIIHNIFILKSLFGSMELQLFMILFPVTINVYEIYTFYPLQNIYKVGGGEGEEEEEEDEDEEEEEDEEKEEVEEAKLSNRGRG